MFIGKAHGEGRGDAGNRRKGQSNWKPKLEGPRVMMARRNQGKADGRRIQK